MSDDTIMTATARKVLTANWFDVSQVRIKCVRGVVNMQGHIEKMSGAQVTPLQIEASLRKMDDSLRALKGFRGAAYFLDNWTRDPTGAWRFSGTKREMERMLRAK